MHERLPNVPLLVLGSANETKKDYPGGWVRFLPRPGASEQILETAEELLTTHGKKLSYKPAVVR